MYEVKVTSEFNGAHRLRRYKGKCEELHGHNWKVEVVLGAESLDDKGMIIDFKELKKRLEKVLDGLDHKYLNEVPYFKKTNPTSENIAKFIYDRLSRKSSVIGRRLTKITVWETGTSAASYYRK